MMCRIFNMHLRNIVRGFSLQGYNVSVRHVFDTWINKEVEVKKSKEVRANVVSDKVFFGIFGDESLDSVTLFPVDKVLPYRVGSATVTPRLASKWLDEGDNIRALSNMSRDNLTRIMENDKFVVQGDCLRFDRNGQMVDGQTRCSACCSSGKSFDAQLVVGIDKEGVKAIDLGRKRSSATYLAALMNPDKTKSAAKWFASVLKLSWTFDKGYGDFSSRWQPSISELEDYFEENSGIIDSVDSIMAVKKMYGFHHPTLYGMLYYQFSKIDKKMADEFIKTLSTDYTSGPSHPFEILRRRLAADRDSKFKMSGKNVFALCVMAWNAARKGERPERLKWNTHIRLRKGGELLDKKVANKSPAIDGYVSPKDVLESKNEA